MGIRGLPRALVVKNPLVRAGDITDTGSVPGSERSPGGGHGIPLQYSCQENPMDRASLQGPKESDMTEVIQHTYTLSGH